MTSATNGADDEDERLVRSGVSTTFEIRLEAAGYRVFATTRWGSDGGRRACAGLACLDAFSTLRAAQAWVELQFEVPTSDWRTVSAGQFFTP